MRYESQQYQLFCKQRFDEIIDGQEKTTKAIQELTCRIYKDNGKESLQSKINRHDLWLRIWQWIFIITAGGIITYFISNKLF